MRIKSEENKLAISALYRVLIASCVCCLCYNVFFFFFPTGYLLDSITPLLSLLSSLALLGYFHANPKAHLKNTVRAAIALVTLIFVPVTFYFTIMAWHGEWRLIERLPPISAIILALLILGLIMLPKKQKKYVILVWALIAIPIIHYLIYHPDELHSSRGYELLSLFGPACLILYVIYPYQSGILHHMDEITVNLRRSEAEAGRDFLTDVYNRRGLQYWLEGLEKKDQISVILIDVDHFKNINDRYGHTTGDRVLVEVASRLRSIYFEKHTITRWGGEEFAVLLVNPKASTLPYIGSMFQNALGALPYKTVGKVTVSVGVSNIAHHENFLELIDQADKALYIAKNNGRDQAVMYKDSLTEHHSQAS